MLRFEVDGVVQLNRKLSRFSEFLDDVRGSYPEIKGAFHEGERQQFAGEKGKGPWAPLSPAYAIRKELEFPGTKILERTRLLLETMTEGTPWLRWKEEPQELAVEILIPYAIFHQRGTTIMPAREVIWFEERTKRAMTQALHRWLVQRQRETRL